jgi:transcriptional regulator with XRE-family HTH domain
MILGNVLYEWRYGKRISQARAADAIGITVGAYTQLEAGKDVTGKNLAIVMGWLLSEQAAPQLSLAAPERAANG